MLTSTNLSATRSDARAMSLFSGVDDAINRAFEVASYRHRSKFREVIESPPKSFNGVDFVESIFQIIKENWESCVLNNGRKPSAENWRWFHPKTALADHNSSAEVCLERALVDACLMAGRTVWSNQVPLASGLVDGSSYRRKAIDLVHRRGDRAFDLIELKVASDNPLYAAMEILQYGIAWLLSRRDRERLGYAGKPIIEADDVLLVVLAPEIYFENRDVRRIGKPLDRGLSVLGEKHGVKLGFQYQSFPSTFRGDFKYEAKELLAALDKRREL
jgi:hypothetical protein